MNPRPRYECRLLHKDGSIVDWFIAADNNLETMRYVVSKMNTSERIAIIDTHAPEIVMLADSPTQWPGTAQWVGKIIETHQGAKK